MVVNREALARIAGSGGINSADPKWSFLKGTPEFESTESVSKNSF
jgi:hypothetical protein